MRVYILLDGSGSMAGQWSDTLGSINDYVSGLPTETDVYLAVFRSGYSMDNTYQVLRCEPAATFKPLTNEEVKPDGGTPLLDSMATILDTAFTDNSERAFIVVMTDGEENSSRRNNKQVIQEKLKRAEDRNWEVIFLGANFDSIHNQSAGLGLASTKSLNMAVGNYSQEMRNLSSHTTAYAVAGTRTNFTSEDVTRAAKKK